MELFLVVLGAEFVDCEVTRTSFNELCLLFIIINGGLLDITEQQLLYSQSVKFSRGHLPSKIILNALHFPDAARILLL